MWTAPGLQGWRAVLDRIACIHMSGLLDAVAVTAGQDGFRDGSSTQKGDVLRHWIARSVSYLGSIDPPPARFLASSGDGAT
jgi:hypothetical protein